MDKILTLEDTKISYDCVGNGPPLLMVHGTSADRSSFSLLKPFLEEHLTIYTMDRRGRKQSIDQDNYAIHREFDDVASLVDEIYKKSDHQPVTLIGHSFGAYCSLEASLLTPNLKSLILYESPPPGIKNFIPSELSDRMQNLLIAGDEEELLVVFLKKIAGITDDEMMVLRGSPNWGDRVTAAYTILREGKGLANLPKFEPTRFQHVDLPVLLLVGEESPKVITEFTDQIHKALNNSIIVELPKQKHLATRRAPELLAKEMLKFVNANNLPSALDQDSKKK